MASQVTLRIPLRRAREARGDHTVHIAIVLYQGLIDSVRSFPANYEALEYVKKRTGGRVWGKYKYGDKDPYKGSGVWAVGV